MITVIKMKKPFTLLLVLFFAFSFSSKALAQEITIPDPAIKNESSSILLKDSINYELPHPGILPTSSLYTLKLIRDGISDLLISDPAEKSNFYLLQADKRLAAAILLFDKGEEELCEETVSKGVDYLEKSLEKMEEAKKGQGNVSDIYGKMNDSLEKQKQEIEKMKVTKDANLAQKLEKNQKRVIELENKVSAFNP